jgi:hypothetical protein
LDKIVNPLFHIEFRFLLVSFIDQIILEQLIINESLENAAFTNELCASLKKYDVLFSILVRESEKPNESILDTCKQQ